MASQPPVPETSAAAAGFRPYVADDATLPELTLRSVVLGVLFGILFGAVSTYLGLRAGLTVSASIPIAVLTISLFKKFGRSSILENNIVQTTGSAGESVAAGVIFTLPAMIFLGFPLEYSRIFLLAMIGGWLGILFMIPLRRQLIVQEHGLLPYPEGAACADVLRAGEKGGHFAGRVFWGLGVGGVYKFLMDALQFWKGTASFNPRWLPGASLRADVTPEYLGVGYIIGPKIAGTMFAGGVVSWLVLGPAIQFFGGALPGALYPSTVPIAQMSADQVWGAYIRPIGAGAVAAAGLITLLRTLPTILRAFRGGARELRAGGARRAAAALAPRTERDLPGWIVLAGAGVLGLLLWAILALRYNTQAAWFSNVVSALLVLLFGFFFVTVSSRIVGLIGNSSNPVSGMTIATLLVTCLLFLLAGWSGHLYAALALSVGGAVSIAAAIAGATSQDLKTGFLVGATPWKQQVTLMIGVVASVVVVGYTVPFLNTAYSSYQAQTFALPQLAANPRVGTTALPGVSIENLHYQLPKGVLRATTLRQYWELNVIGSHTIPDGTYLYNPASGKVEIQWVQGIGSEQVAAPQARLMATIINGLLNRQLPWALILIGVFLVVAVELLGIRSLAFAVGSYLGIGTTATIFVGGALRWLAERGAPRQEGETGSGALYSSGLIAGAAVFGLVAAAISYLEATGRIAHGQFAIGPRLLGSAWAGSNLWALALFALLCGSLYRFARKPLEGGEKR
ncbi:MAG TPA: oligopeptide transporter, OPT family [Terriglobales bacterium]|nr:oligopeptide transporter, OPT family [Terriglobales bacterium]